MSDIEARVKKIIAEQLGVEEGQVTSEKAFVADLGADSLDTVELVMALEDEFGIEIPDDSAITIASEGLLGGNFVEIVPGGSPFMFEPSSEIEDTQSAVSLVSLLLKFVSGSGE